MRRFLQLFLVTGVAMLLCVSQLNATTTILFYDDFEEADAAGTYMPDTPPIGPDWTEYYPGSTMHWIANNPAPDSVNSSALTLYQHRTMTAGTSIMQIPIYEADQALIAANGNLTFEMKFYNVGIENSKGLYLMGEDTISGTFRNRAFNPIFWGNGTIESQVYDGSTWSVIDTGLRYTNDAWHTIKIVADFATDTYDLWVDGQTTANAQDLAFCHLAVDLSTIARIAIGPAYKPSQFYIDDVLVSTVPEPSTTALLMIGALLMGMSFLRRR